MDKNMEIEVTTKEEWKAAVEIVGLQFHVNKILKMIKIDEDGNQYLDRDTAVDVTQLDESKATFWGCANNPYCVSIIDEDKDDGKPVTGMKKKIVLHFSSDSFPAKLLCILSYKYNLMMEMVTKPTSIENALPFVMQLSPIGVRQLEAEEVMANKQYWLDKLEG